MTDNRWLIYALLGAVAAALTNIFGKVGMKGIDPTMATTVRSLVMLLFLILVCTAQDRWHHLSTIRGWAVLMIVLSGLAGATSWLFGFKALAFAAGEVTRVAPIDKLSVPLAAVLAFLLLHERPSARNWAGILLIAFGAYLAALPRTPKTEPHGLPVIVGPRADFTPPPPPGPVMNTLSAENHPPAN